MSFPHYFLQATGYLAEQLKTREWIVARITSITERIVDHKVWVSSSCWGRARWTDHCAHRIQAAIRTGSATASSTTCSRSRTGHSPHPRSGACLLGRRPRAQRTRFPRSRRPRCPCRPGPPRRRTKSRSGRRARRPRTSSPCARARPAARRRPPDHRPCRACSRRRPPGKVRSSQSRRRHAPSRLRPLPRHRRPPRNHRANPHLPQSLPRRALLCQSRIKGREPVMVHPPERSNWRCSRLLQRTRSHRCGRRLLRAQVA